MKQAVTLVSITRRQSSSDSSRNGLRTMTAALLTRMSSRPNRFSTSSKAAPTAAGAVTSNTNAAASAPLRQSSAARSVTLSLRSASARRAPAAASAEEIPDPMPPAAPVTSATLPRSENRVAGASCSRLRPPVLAWTRSAVISSTAQRPFQCTTLASMKLIVRFINRPMTPISATPMNTTGMRNSSAASEIMNPSPV
jgi:hypothetical protein